MATTYCNDARSKVAPSGGRAIAGTSLTVVDGSKFQGTTGAAPSPSSPAKLTIIRYTSAIDYIVVTVLKCTGRTGNVLTIDGATESYADAAVLDGDLVFCGPTAGDMEALQAGIAANAAGLANLSIAGLIAVPTDGSILIESGAGTAASPYRLRAARRTTIGWMVAADAAGATGDAADPVPAPYLCRMVSARMHCRTNPTLVLTAQVKVAGSNHLATALSIAGGSTTPSERTSDFATPSIAKGAAIVPNWSALPSDARGVVITVELLEVP